MTALILETWQLEKNGQMTALTRGRRNQLRGYVRNRGTSRLRIFLAS